MAEKPFQEKDGPSKMGDRQTEKNESGKSSNQSLKCQSQFGSDGSADEMNGTDSPLPSPQPMSGNGSSDGPSWVPREQRGRYRSTSSASGSEDEHEKRQKVDTRARGFLLPGLAASPPRFVSLEQIMKAANGVTNMALAHEIAVDKDFKLEKVNPSEDSLERQVTDIVHRAFWDAFETQLAEDPPNYQQAMVLLKEVKESLLSLLLPHHTKVKEQISEVLDVDLICQQAEHASLDFNYYAQYIISVMAKLCAPVRDETIRDLMKITDIVPMYREILKTLDVMKLDMANFAIQQMRPHIQQHSIEYEKQKFAEFLETQADGLEFTRAWFQRVLDGLGDLQEDQARPIPVSSGSNPSVVEKKATTDAIITKAYLILLDWDESWTFPETLLMDRGRFLDLRDRVKNVSLIASMLLVTFSTIGPSIASLTHFKEQLKDHVTVLLNSADNNKGLQEATASVAVQVIKEVNECLTKHGFNTLDESSQKGLIGQIEELADPDARIRNLVKQRIVEFVAQVLTSSTASPIRIPPGLSTMQAELARVTGQFLRLVSHNRSVFGDYYVDIIHELRSRASIGKEEETKALKLAEKQDGETVVNEA